MMTYSRCARVRRKQRADRVALFEAACMTCAALAGLFVAWVVWG